LPAHDPTQLKLSAAQYEALLKLDTCQVSNAIETFNVRMRDEGHASPGIRCLTKANPRVLGYAVPCRVSTDRPPVSGRASHDRADWWSLIQNFPAPRVAVVQDISRAPGSGAVAGEVHSAILMALGCAGLITNGSVRDVPAVSRLKFPLFATGQSPSHRYFHLVDFGETAEINGLKVHPGDLIYADCSGIISIPLDIAASIPAMAARQIAQERSVIELCFSPAFTVERLRNAIEGLE
jgi:4-hydroxy-4-methyl-2-oxoglutarate aldolase